jgi:hypothetical protein
MASTKTLLVRTIGGLVALAVVGLIAGTVWISSLYQSEQKDAAQASAAFAEVRARFTGVEPAFVIRDRRLVVMREPAGQPSSTSSAAAFMLVWLPQERMLSRIRIPLWVSNVATEPLPLEALAGIADQGFGGLTDARRRGNELNIRLSDLRRYGPTLLLDGVTPDGKHVMLWNE